MAEKLDRIRSRSDIDISGSAEVVRLLLIVAMGCAAGFLAKFFDLLPYLRAWGPALSRIFEGIAQTGSMYSVWIFAGSLIAAYSRSSLFAGIHCFFFFFSMNVIYYIYQTGVYHLSYGRYFLFWMIIAAASAPMGYAMWYAKGSGKIAVLLAAGPVSAILAESLFLLPGILKLAGKSTFVYAFTGLVSFLFCLAAASTLLLLLPKDWHQRLYTLLFALPLIPLCWLFMKYCLSRA